MRWAPPVASNPWSPTFHFFYARLRRAVWKIAFSALIFCGLGVAAKIYLPSTYNATSQLLFDPRGLKIFANELSSGHIDANAAVTFVESQMGVLQSERVLSRVMETECTAALMPFEEDAPAVLRTAPPLAFTALCPEPGPSPDWSRTLQSLQRALVIKRAERSFVVDVTTAGPSPQSAARLASAVVKAYTDEDAANRAQAAKRLTDELSGRLESLRQTLRASEARADLYRRDQNLIRVADKLLVEQSLAAATVALNESRSRLDRTSARVRQLEFAPRTASAFGALGADAETRSLMGLIERRGALMVEVAPLALRAGARHPALIEVRSRLFEVDRSIAAEMASIRAAAQGDLVRLRAEQDMLAETVAELAEKVTQARQAEIELRALEQDVDTNRKLLESFETRSREAAEFGRIDAGNLRVVSLARAPETQKLVPKLVLWGIIGLVLGVMLSVSGVMFFALLALGRTETKDKEPDQPGNEPADNGPAYAMRLRAHAFAQYRYG